MFRVDKFLFFSALFCCGLAFAQKGPEVDYDLYDSTSLYEQIKGRIREKILDKIGDAYPAQDRYFLTTFAYQDRTNQSEQSHTFATVVKITTARTVEHFTISWLPYDFKKNPNLCVFKGGLKAVFFASMNKCRTKPGKNFTLKETLSFAQRIGNAVGMWGPYEIRKEFFDVGVARKKFLESGAVKYRADDRATRVLPKFNRKKPNQIRKVEAINCFHAIADLNVDFPRGGFLGLGFKIWGVAGTKRNLKEYKAKIGHLLMDRIDEENDVYGFVYTHHRSVAPTTNPFEQASAYQVFKKRR